MIPKIIHCCWLSGSAKTPLAECCRRSWERFAPDYEIREWNSERLRQKVEVESGIAIPPFVRDAIAHRRWAFAADWVRFAALYLDGGIYFDYDFELVNPIGDLGEQGEFVAGQWKPDGSIGMEPAIIALEKGSPIAKMMLDHYAEAAFDGITTVGEILAQQLTANHQTLTTLPPEVMSPIDVKGACHRTAATIGIHHYAMSWASPKRRLARWLAWHGGRGLIERILKIRDKWLRHHTPRSDKV